MSNIKELPIAWGNKINATEGAIKPYRAHQFDAGRDIFIQEDKTIQPGETAYLSAGVSLQLKPGWAGFVMTRSSTFKKGLSVIPTIVDSGYTNEISTIVTNHQSYPISVEKGDRLAQLLLIPVFDFENEENNVSIGKEYRKANDKFGSSGSNDKDMGGN